VGIDFLFFGIAWGNALTGGGVGLLKRPIWKSSQFRSLEDDSSLLDVVYLKGTQCSKL
jgi:hypothetical protein